MSDTSSFKYRGWDVHYVCPPIPVRSFDWCATHKDYDGEGDNRYVTGATKAEVMLAVDEWFMENEEEPEPVSVKDHGYTVHRCRIAIDFCKKMITLLEGYPEGHHMRNGIPHYSERLDYWGGQINEAMKRG